MGHSRGEERTITSPNTIEKTPNDGVRDQLGPLVPTVVMDSGLCWILDVTTIP